MFRDSSVAVVIPAYREELLIGDTLSSIPEYVDKIYAVNDCSPDKTGEIIDEFAKKDPRIVPVHHEKNMGVGAAIVSGYRHVLEDNFDIAAVMAGDNQMDPEFLPQLLDPLVDGKCDYSMGNRLLSPDFRRGMSKWRFFGNALLTMFTKIASGYWQMVDPQNGYTAITRRALERINLNDIYPRYGYCNDILVKLNVFGFKVKNIPHPAKYGKEKSGIRYSTYIFKVSWLLLKDFIWRLKMKFVVLSFHPLVFFYFFGVIFTVLGIIGGLFSLWEKFYTGVSLLFVHGCLSFLVFLMGMMFLLFAMLYDMEQERSMNGWY